MGLHMYRVDHSLWLRAGSGPYTQWGAHLMVPGELVNIVVVGAVVGGAAGTPGVGDDPCPESVRRLQVILAKGNQVGWCFTEHCARNS